jgi:probable addiction module antidote protein
MPRKSRPFQDLLLERLANPEIAKHYLNEALEESSESFLKALKIVAQAKQMAKVARNAGIQRETLYRSLSGQGNPTLDTLSSVLKAVGLRIFIGVEGVDEPAVPVAHSSSVGREDQESITSPFANILSPVAKGNDADRENSSLYENRLLPTGSNSWTDHGALSYAACGNR